MLMGLWSHEYLQGEKVRGRGIDIPVEYMFIEHLRPCFGVNYVCVASPFFPFKLSAEVLLDDTLKLFKEVVSLVMELD